MEDWKSKAIALMHEHRITQKTLAEHLCLTDDYISLILLGKRHPKNAEQRVMNALNEIIEERNREV